MNLNHKLHEKLETIITPYLKNPKDWKKKLGQEVLQALLVQKAVHTLVGEIKGHTKQTNEEGKDYLVLWLAEGQEKIYVYQDCLTRPKAWQELINCQYRQRIVYLDFQKLYKLKILIDIRYEKKEKI